MSFLKSSISLILFLVLLSGFILIIGVPLHSDQGTQVTESKVGQTPQGEEAKITPIKLEDKVWHGKISKNETKSFEWNLLFQDEGKFFIQAHAGAYDKNLKVWKILGEYWVNVTIKKGEDGKVERTFTRPKVTPRKMTGGPGVTVNPWEKAHMDTSKAKSTQEQPKAIPPPGPPPWPLYQSMHLGEAPINFIVSFEQNPKLNEPTKLVLSASSAVDRDSIVVSLTFGENVGKDVKVIK